MSLSDSPYGPATRHPSPSDFDPDLCPERLTQVAEMLLRGGEDQQQLAQELLQLAGRLRKRAAC